MTVTAEPVAEGSRLEVRALDLDEHDSFDLAGAPERSAGWRSFVRGTAAELAAAGVELRPARLEVGGDLPRGAGLASSAALCVALALALCAVAGAEPPERRALAATCSRVENEWVGARTGLLDQLACLFGEEGRALRLDMRELTVEPVALELSDHRLVTLDSGVPRELGTSAYNERRAECAAAAGALAVPSLRDAPPDAAAALREPLGRRARHVLEENARVEEMVAALEAGDLPWTGRLLDASHASLRDLYDASVPAVERTVAGARRAGALGARMVGGGFGGHVLALFPPGAEPPAGAREVRPAAGARLL